MKKWVTVWGNATSIADRRPENYARNLTLRYPVCCAFGGDKLRLHFSNFCGLENVTFDSVTIAYALSDREIDIDSLKPITFGGKTQVTLAAGEELFSDEIDFHAESGKKISVSIYLKGFTLMRSAVVVTGPLSGGFYSVGDYTYSPRLPLDYTRSTNTYYFLTGVDFLTESNNRAVICYGDSITSQSWPDYLSLLCMQNLKNTAIIRRAASGTRVLREYKCITYESYGLSGEHRFKREISTLSGADTVIIQQGINDIIHPVGTDVNPFRPMSDLPTAAELEEGLKYYVDIAKSFDLKVYFGTLLPIFGWRTYAPFREKLKGEINDWIKYGSPADGCIDFEKALRSDENPYAFKEGFDSGDHLHPSEQAYKIMALTAYEEIKS